MRRPPKCCQATKSDILRSCPDFLSPPRLHRKSSDGNNGSGLLSDRQDQTHRARQSDETGVKKQNGRSKRFDSRYHLSAPFRGLKRLVKNLSKRLEQQQQLVRSLVTLTVKEWARSQMYTLFWDFCKIKNPFRISGKERIHF